MRKWFLMPAKWVFVVENCIAKTPKGLLIKGFECF